MSLASHLEELQRKHGDVERQLDEAMNHPSMDDLQIVALKRRKLALKDEIEKLRTGPTQH
ncbi:YdcH family protein [Aminobacter sp. HY435]|uniref:YdcH family protein n=1 Tax=Aminobacter sp. HY435 TaxID=2970917 RepID=UPI0022B955A9|nr:YdcH family protein [Aminobacter sp. HY435]